MFDIVYTLMHKIYLINKKSFINDVHAVSLGCTTITGTLYFVKKYYDVQSLLSFMISDLANIIMTYVNDEFEISYVVSIHHNSTEIFFKMNCEIWFVNYTFGFSLFLVADDEILFYVSRENNILKTSEQTFQIDEIDNYVFESYNYNFNVLIYNYALQCGITFRNITSYIEYKEPDPQSYLTYKFNPWIPIMFVKTLKMIYTNSKRQLRNVIVILKLIDSALSKN